MSEGDRILFDVQTPIGVRVRCTAAYWEYIVREKHPVLDGRADEIAETLRDPDEIRRSRRDAAVLLFYRGARPRWTCAVTRAEGGAGFLITAYPTDAIKAGERIWTK